MLVVNKCSDGFRFKSRTIQEIESLDLAKISLEEIKHIRWGIHDAYHQTPSQDLTREALARQLARLKSAIKYGV